MPVLPTGNEIGRLYEILKDQFSQDQLSTNITNMFIQIGECCAALTGHMNQLSLTSTATSRGKNYVVFETSSGKQSRPINIDLYNEGIALDDNGNSKIAVFWQNVLQQTISNQKAEDITAAVYVIAMDYFICADAVEGIKPRSYAKYFEMLIGHLYARHLNISPSSQLSAVELDGESISLPTDFIFDLGAGKPKLHIPVKTSTRERCVEVWAQQRILDGAFGVGRFFCLLTCVGEQNREKDAVGITCVPNQWINYQLFIAQILRAYYLDVPDAYRRLNERFPKIHVKEFGEFFHEFDHLFD